MTYKGSGRLFDETAAAALTGRVCVVKVEVEAEAPASRKEQVASLGPWELRNIQIVTRPFLDLAARLKIRLAGSGGGSPRGVGKMRSIYSGRVSQPGWGSQVLRDVGGPRGAQWKVSIPPVLFVALLFQPTMVLYNPNFAHQSRSSLTCILHHDEPETKHPHRRNPYSASRPIQS